MFTLKLKNTRADRIDIIECGSVSVVALGNTRRVLAKTPDAPDREYHVGVGAPYDIAYVENSYGATTQVIR